MKHYISIISHDSPPAMFVESAVRVTGPSLHDANSQRELVENATGHALRIPLSRCPGEAEADQLAESVANILFEMGHDDFDIEVTNDQSYDPVDDCIVFMKNDPLFYRRHYFPAVLKMKDTDSESVLDKMVDTAMSTYCSKFELGSKDTVFKDGDKDAILKQVYSEESSNIAKGEYD